MKKKQSTIYKITVFAIFTLLILLFITNYNEVSRFAVRMYFKLYNILDTDNEVDQSKNLKNFGIPIPVKYKIHGIDVSKYQGRINWSEVKKMKVDSIKIDFVFIKATEGKTIIDRFFEINWNNARRLKKALIIFIVHI